MRGDSTGYRRSKPSDNYFYRPVKVSSSARSSGRVDDFVTSNLTKEFLKLHMGGHSSWSDYEFIEGEKETTIFDSAVNDDQESSVSMDILADELHEHILAFLPFACILRVRSVCKMWNEIVLSKRFQECISGGLSMKPWYFMSDWCKPRGFLYDPVLNKWYFFELPFKMKYSSTIASSLGLVCFKEEFGSDLIVCNVINKSYKELVLPDELGIAHCALAFSVDSKSSQYTVAVVRSREPDIQIDVYFSETLTWNCRKKTLQGWNGGISCAIVNGILYVLLGTFPRVKHCLVLYDLTVPSNDKSEDTTLAIPFSLYCGLLMNLQDKLVMVGGITKHGPLPFITGIGIWVLNGTKWEEVARVPPMLFQGFGRFLHSFTCSGSGGTVYIHPHLVAWNRARSPMLVFDMNLRKWKCAAMFPENYCDLLTGFCFSPRLDVSAG